MRITGRRNIEIAIELMPIEEDGYHIFIPARINGKKARFLIDTGASRSVVDHNRIGRFFNPEGMVLENTEKLSTGLGTNTMESKTIVITTLSFGQMVLHHYQTVALDLTHINESYGLLGMKKIDGVIGGDLLAKLNAVIDYHKKSFFLLAKDQY